MIWERLRKRLRSLFRTRAASADDGPPSREPALSLVRPDEFERIFFHRRSDGLWDYVVEAFAVEEEPGLAFTLEYWHPIHVSGLHDSLPSALREAAAGRAWVVECEDAQVASVPSAAAA